MAVMHKTTMSPGKLELLTAWLPAQPWYLHAGGKPELSRAGGFRLDDRLGEVGIEFSIVTDGAGDQATAYLVPVTYRGHALADADGGLIGTAEHGVLGPRWIYDGTRDPALVTELVAFIQGETVAQAQAVSDTPDPTVIAYPVTAGSLTVRELVEVSSGPSGTDLRIATVTEDGSPGSQLIVRINRVLRRDGDLPLTDEPCVSGTWRQPNGERVRGTLATASYIPR